MGGIKFPYIFPTRVRLFTKLPPKYLNENLTKLLGSMLGDDKVRYDVESGAVKVGLVKPFGTVVDVEVMSEDGSSSIEFRFRYNGLLYTALILTFVTVSLTLILSSIYPLIGLLAVIPLIHKTKSSAIDLLNKVSEALPYLEEEYTRITLQEERRRWMEQPKDAEELYRRLEEKYKKLWGSTYILEYKIREYMEQLRLTREEAIRKTAEEEGIY